MPSIVIRLYPVDGAVAGDDFRHYLDDLTITAFDLSTQGGETQIGAPATYTEPGDLTHPEIPDPGTFIVQHAVLVNPIAALYAFQAAATAVIEDASPNPPAGWPEHATRDLRLEITRGTGTIVQRQIHVNVPENPGGVPSDRADFESLEPTSLYLALPAPGVEKKPSDAYVELSADGSPPAYGDLLNAVAVVLGDDPGGALDLSTLTAPQARHVAREIAWNQKFRRMPGPTGVRIGDLFTDPVGSDAQAEAGRFTGELKSYEAVGNADAERLSAYVFALVAAVIGEARSTNATVAGLTFPVLPGQTGTGERYQEVRVRLTALPAVTRFTVPARYFYALGAGLPVAHDADQRYRDAVLADDERVRSALVVAKDAGIIEETPPTSPATLPAGQPPVADAPSINIVQAVRRLRALGDVGGSPAEVAVTGDVQALVSGWLLEPGADIDAAFWDVIAGAVASGHLDLDLTAITRGYVVPTDGTALRDKLRARLGVTDAAQLASASTSQWTGAMTGDSTWPDNLPDWTMPGSQTERLQAFLQEVAKFFVVAPPVSPVPTAGIDAPPLIRTPSGDPINGFVAAYQARAGSPFVFGGAWNAADSAAAVDDVAAALFPGDAPARAWLESAVSTIDELVRLASVAPAGTRFSIVESLFARGFTSRVQVAAMPLQEFRDALVGTVAFDLADVICIGAGGPGTASGADVGDFHPINSDGCLVNCVPPEHLSPVGPVSYLRELLSLRVEASCQDPEPTAGQTLGDLVTARRGPLGDLAVTAANASTPLPLIDLVNESLEALAAAPGSTSGAVYDTASTALSGHALAPAAGGSDPATLFAALPEHSSPAWPGASAAAYAALRHDAGHPLLPYVQGLDLNRSYLGALGTCRYDVMRAFRRDITEFVLSPDAEPPGFRRQVWRYPVRLDLALEYLCISREEYEAFFARDLQTESEGDGWPLWQAYGFESQLDGGVPWSAVAVRVPEFLERTGIDWCELVELWRTGVVPFERVPVDPARPDPARFDPARPDSVIPDYHRDSESAAGKRRGAAGNRVRGPAGETDSAVDAFPDCEPCDRDCYDLDFDDRVNGLRRLMIVIRLWRAVSRCEPALTIEEFGDVCSVLALFDDSGVVNPDFVRQLAALQMIRKDFGVPLRAAGRQDAGSGTARTPLLALWAGPPDEGWDWAVAALLDHVRSHAVHRMRARPKRPEFLEVVAANLDPLSELVGFDPASSTDSWRSRPTHTLRFAEVLAKLYASDLGVGELQFLVTAAEHVPGDDPFPLQSRAEALDDPLESPEEDRDGSLWALRDRLLSTTEPARDREKAAWGWTRIETVLRRDFGYEPSAGPADALTALGSHFFPGVLEREGITSAPADTRWGVSVAGTPAAMWNTPPDGPFRYLAGQITSQLPLRQRDVLAKLGRVRQLAPDEQTAVRDLLASPRAALVPFAFLFDDFEAAVTRLTEEADEDARFAFFQHSVSLAHARAWAIARHLARHVEAATGDKQPGTAELAFRLLTRLHADENPATSGWEDDSGQAPDHDWARPTGGAFAALLAVTGTGLLGEFRPAPGASPKPSAAGPVWREVRGPLTAFGAAENAANAPVPGILPALDTTITADQGRFVAVRNGLAITDTSDAPLGGARGFTAHWSGVLLVERPGGYSFRAGTPALEDDGDDDDRDDDARDDDARDDDARDDDEPRSHERGAATGWPSHRGTHGKKWRVSLRRGQRTWVLLEHRWAPNAEAPKHRAKLDLRRGAYDIDIEYAQLDPDLDDPDDIMAATAGFELAYAGPDSDGRPMALPRTRLYRPTQSPQHLDEDIEGLTAVERQFLHGRYTGSLRDIRRTYQRAFKALLLMHRIRVSAAPVADDGQSEIEYLLEHSARFSGASYYRVGAGFSMHQADLDPDLLPVADPYHPPDVSVDARVAPTVRRSQALTDWWERLFDYSVLRDGSANSPERPAWLLFHESAEGHPDLGADLLRYLDVDLQRTDLVSRYDGGPDLVSDDLLDEQWAVRIGHADSLLRRMLRSFLFEDIRIARPDLWATADPSAPDDQTSGNANLVRVVTDGLIENGQPRRYADLAALNDCLRENARAALLAYLCRWNRVSTPWGTANKPEDVGDLLLQDVSVTIPERASRIDEAISAVQTLVTRARLGLEPGFVPSAAFLALWDIRYARFVLWRACTLRELYKENWIDIEAFAEARRGEAFRFLETELRRVTITRPEPGGLEYWAAAPAPVHPGITALQVRDPSTLSAIDPRGHGFDLMGTPERGARPSWLSAIRFPAPRGGGGGGEPGTPDAGTIEHPHNEHLRNLDSPVTIGTTDDAGAAHAGAAGGEDEGSAVAPLPWWVPAAIRLGARFLRVAAAGEPPACSDPSHLAVRAPGWTCCATCCASADDVPGPVVDEYYFWLVDARQFDALTQDSNWAWHDDTQLQQLLSWGSGPMVRLAWSRVHGGELGPVGFSTDGVRVTGAATLDFAGRIDDSLTFSVSNAQTPAGYPLSPLPGFRFDLADGSTVVLPEVVTPPPTASPPIGPLHPGQLPAYPYFIGHRPGAPLFPVSPYAPAVAVAATLRAHCRPEAALNWYELAADPLHSDSSWVHCDETDGSDGDPVILSEPAGTKRQKRRRKAAAARENQSALAARRAPAVGRRSGCRPDSTQATDDEVRRRSVVLHYLDTLAEAAVTLTRHGDSPESYAQARVVLETASRLLGERPRSVRSPVDAPDTPMTISDFAPDPAPVNPRLLSLYDRVADELALVRSWQTAERLPRGRLDVDVRYLDDSGLAEGWIETDGIRDTCCDDGCSAASPYRFLALVGRARDLAGEVRALGSSLLAAYEKGDVEYLSDIRQQHDRQLQASAVSVRKLQWRDADWQVQALEKTKQVALTNRRYYADLVEAGLNQGENDYLALTEQAVASHGTSIPLEAAGQAMGFIPDIWLGVAGMGPLNANQLPLGTKLSGVFATAARIAGTVGQIAGITAGERLTEGGWQRREEDWRHQVEILDIEIEQIERQILGAERRRDAALHELNDQQLRLEQSRDLERIVREKLTGHALYLWLQQETSALYWHSYELAVRCARQAQRAFNFERGHTGADFLSTPLWNGRHEGLLAGERLELALRQMELTFHDQNVREYELVKNVSLRLTAPLEFLRLQATGRCEIELPEWLFDLDYPGQYMRRIKSVSLSIPAVVGPFGGVHSRLTLLSSTTRVSPELVSQFPRCCGDESCGCERACEHECSGDCGCNDGCGCGRCACGLASTTTEADGYTLSPDDRRVVRNFASHEAIATSSAQTDSGMFEVNFHDDRYLHFEYQGAVSRWLFELPQENNQFDVDTVSDVILHLSYTAREGGERLRLAASRQSRCHLPGSGLRVLDVERDLPDAWSELQRATDGEGGRLPIGLRRSMFPWLPAAGALMIPTIDFFIEAPCAHPGVHHPVRFRPAKPARPVPAGDRHENAEGERWADEFEDIECIASAEWPGLFHGVLADTGPGLVGNGRPVPLGEVLFPESIGAISRVWLLCRFEPWRPLPPATATR